MGPFEFFKENCGRSAFFFFVGILLPVVVLIAFGLAGDLRDFLNYYFSSPYFEPFAAGLAGLGLLIAALLARKAILGHRRAPRRKRQSDRRALSQNELRAARSKLLGNPKSGKL